MSELSRIRIGNDIDIKFEIFRDGILEDVSDIKRMNIWIIRDDFLGAIFDISNINSKNNPVSFTINGNMRHVAGKYMATIQYFKDNGDLPDRSHVVDAMAFELVNTSAEQEIAEDTMATTIMLTGNILIGGGDGRDGISVTNAEINNEGHLIITLSDGREIDAGLAVGSDGNSAYEIAVEHGFEGTEAEWLESLKGEPGTVFDITRLDNLETFKENQEQFNQEVDVKFQNAQNQLEAHNESPISHNDMREEMTAKWMLLNELDNRSRSTANRVEELDNFFDQLLAAYYDNGERIIVLENELLGSAGILKRIKERL